jgi:hypothetical protein
MDPADQALDEELQRAAGLLDRRQLSGQFGEPAKVARAGAARCKFDDRLVFFERRQDQLILLDRAQVADAAAQKARTDLIDAAVVDISLLLSVV